MHADSRYAWIICKIGLSAVIYCRTEVCTVACPFVSELLRTGHAPVPPMLRGVCGGIKVQGIRGGPVAGEYVPRSRTCRGLGESGSHAGC